MELRLLRYFVAVAEERNFTRAAERLHMAQPPLSRQIQLLEEEVGAILIDREARPLVLTSSGRLFLDHARDLLQRADAMQAAIRRLQGKERPRFTIGFVASTIYAALPELIRRFRAAAPEVDLHVVEMVSLHQAAALKEHQIDVGFGRVRFEDHAIRRDVLREERLVVALPQRHRLAVQEHFLSLLSLSGEPLIVYPKQPRPSYADQILSLFHDRGMTPLLIHEVNELQTAIGLVAAEVGIAIVPTSMTRLRREDVLYRELEDPTITSPIIMSRRIDDGSAHLALMIRVIREAYLEWGWPAPAGLNH